MFNMIKYSALAVALLVIPATAANAAMTNEECAALLTKNDTNGDGALGKNEDAKRFGEAMIKSSQKTMSADVVSHDEFMAACEKGTFDGM